MKYFICLLDPTGQGISEASLRPYEVLPSLRRLECRWQRFAGAAVLSASDDWAGDPLVAEEGDHLAVGIVRLDNRKDIERWTDAVGLELTDLHLVLRWVT